MPGSLADAVEEIVREAAESGAMIYTDEAVKRLRRAFPENPASSQALADALIQKASACRVPVRMEVPLEII